MKLTKVQIEQLKKMISKKGYVHIDVQYEILDHVACKIEELLEEGPTLSLEDAFRKVHSSFGIFGFSTLEESYTKSIHARVKKVFLARDERIPYLLSNPIPHSTRTFDLPSFGSFERSQSLGSYFIRLSNLDLIGFHWFLLAQVSKA